MAYCPVYGYLPDSLAFVLRWNFFADFGSEHSIILPIEGRYLQAPSLDNAWKVGFALLI